MARKSVIFFSIQRNKQSKDIIQISRKVGEEFNSEQKSEKTATCELSAAARKIRLISIRSEINKLSKTYNFRINALMKRQKF